MKYSRIKQAVVLAREQENTRNKYLVAYYISENGDKLKEADILSYLSSKLPEYMIPSVLVHMDKLPLTINGKLDRKALPDPILGSDTESYTGPRNDLETRLCTIFAEVLGLEVSKVGINDNFFRLGGDSIISIQLVSRIRQKLDISSVTIKDIFTFKTIKKLYDNVINPELKRERNIISEGGILSGKLPLLPIQEWFFDNDFAVPYHWNQSFIVKTPKLDIGALKESMEALVGYHDAFRLKYRQGNIQYYDAKASIEEIRILDVSKLSSEEKIHDELTNWQSSFNLEKGPTYAIGYLYGFSDGSSRVFFSLHHLIVDGVSWRILTEGLKELYNQAINNQPLSLGVKGTSYRQWANIVRGYSNKQEKAYWNNIKKELPVVNKELSNLSTGFSQTSHISLSDKMTTKLLKDSIEAYNTEINDLLLSSLVLSLKETLGMDVGYITLEGHGREEGITKESIDISRTVGWFTAMYPVKLNSHDDLAATIKKTKENLRAVPNKGIGYGSMFGYNILPNISFNYLGQLDLGQLDQRAGKTWHIASETSGNAINEKNKDRNIININGAILGGEATFQYS